MDAKIAKSQHNKQFATGKFNSYKNIKLFIENRSVFNSMVNNLGAFKYASSKEYNKISPNFPSTF